MGKKKVTETNEKEVVATPASKKGASSTPATAPTQAKKGKRIEFGRVYVKCSYNNTVITVSDMQGNVIAWASAGSVGFSGPKKATPFAASKIISVISEKLHAVGMKQLEVLLKGIGGGRDSAVRSLINQGFMVNSIKDVTPIPHNGPRRAKVRRV
jgi:small subunit ribosomal protein S11